MTWPKYTIEGGGYVKVKDEKESWIEEGFLGFDTDRRPWGLIGGPGLSQVVCMEREFGK